MSGGIPDWRERAARYVAGNEPPGTRVEAMQGDASTRRYVRVIPPGRTTRVLMIHPAPIDPHTLPFVTVGDLLARIDVRVPAVLGQAPELGILVLEDLGDMTLERALKGAGALERRTWYREAVAVIATMQQRAPALRAAHPGPFAMAFDAERLTWELEFFLTHFVGRARGVEMPDARQAAARTEFTLIARELASEARVFCHRDYHSRNLLLHAGHLHVIDFQDARLGPDTYDLVSLLRDCYVDVEAGLVAAMVDEFLGLAGRRGGAAYRDRFDLMSVQRHLKALGTFGYQAAEIGTDRYQTAVRRTLGYLASTFRRQPRFDRLRAALAAAVPELG